MTRAQRKSRHKIISKSSVAPDSLTSGPVVPLETIPQPLKRKRDSGETSKEAVQSAISLPSAFEMAEPVPRSTQSSMTLAHHQVSEKPVTAYYSGKGTRGKFRSQHDQPSAVGIGDGSLLEPKKTEEYAVNVGGSTNLSRFNKTDHQYRRSVQAGAVASTNLFRSSKPTASKNPYPSFKTDHRYRRKAQADGNRSKADPCRSSCQGGGTRTGGNERSERLMKKFYETMKAKSIRFPSSGGLPKSSRPLGQSQSSAGPHRPTPSESLQQRTREWVEGTLKKQ